MNTDPFIAFNGKTVLVTGASGGIGRAISVELSRSGAGLILAGRNDEKLKETAEALDSNNHHIMIMDLNETASIFKETKHFLKELGQIYGLCHCAGVVETRPLRACKPDSIQKMLNVNLIAGLELARAVCRRDIMEEDGGSLLFISSIYSIIGMPGQIGYSASKGAISSAVRSLAIELSRRKIRVNSLSPGLVHTDLVDTSYSLLSKEQIKDLEESFPLGAGTAKDVARAAVFLLAPQSKWITGTDLVIDGGYTAR